MFISDVLERKGTEVISIGPGNSVVDTTRILKGRGIGALVVQDESEHVVGIISERDIIHWIAMHGENGLGMPVRDVMTTDVITCKRNDTINEAMKVMVDHAFRHLPVVEDGELKGLVSISDVVKLRIKDLERQIGESKIFNPDH
jgi:CBS domain-containing protein